MKKCWNKRWYQYGNVFKVTFRNHQCRKCGEKLAIVKHRKIVDQKSEEAKYYDFDVGLDIMMIGPCEFVHKVFYCPKCLENIEFVTQINQEDVDIVIKNVINYFKKKDREIFISKNYETKSGDPIEQNVDLNDEVILCLMITENNREIKKYKIPVRRKGFWERPYYFDLRKKDLISFVENAL